MPASFSLKSFIRPVLIILLGISLIGASILMLRGTDIFESGGVEIIEESTAKGGTAAPASGDLVVEVAGAVSRPGVYHFPLGARINEALEKAGGVTEKAHGEFVAQSINQAAKLVDGQKIYIPFEDEKPVLGVTTSTVSLGSTININSATQSELESLPGVGPVTARKIIDNRPYGSLEELTAKKAVSAKVFGEITDKISLY